MSKLRFVPFAFACVLAVPFGCAPATPDTGESEELAEDAEVGGEGLTGTVPAGTTLRATGNVNLRTGASTKYKILHVVPKGSKVTVDTSSPKNGYYRIDHNGTVGWSYGKYYEPTGGTTGNQPVGTVLTATGNVNLRTGPSTSYKILKVVKLGTTVTMVKPDPSNGFYNLNSNGTVGWSSAKYYSKGGSSGGGTGGGGNTGGANVTAAMARAASAVGFSYWWGHGRFRSGGPTGNAGSCSGSCPSCSHSGSYGGDCSGLVAKVWQVPSSNNNLSKDSHPYSTANFVKSSSQWKIVSRSSVKKADALVYRKNGAGHIFVHSKGDGWGSMYAYECKGCSAGCVKGYRTASSAYKAIRRNGY